MAKDQVPVEVVEHGSPPEVGEKWKGTDSDRHDMLVIGRPQQLRRNFHLVSILGFGATLISTWEINAA
jgi:hypothetical protein